MKKNKGDIISIIFAVILILLILIIAFIATLQRQANEQQTPLATPTQIVVQTTPREPNVTPIGQEPLVSYSQEDQDKLMDKIIHRQTLSTNDSFAKANILSVLPDGQRSGILYQSGNITIDYTDSADMFQVEITTPDVNIAKAEANVWFRARGMTQKGICDLPLMFYINYETMIKLRNSGTRFSPLANSC
jgi:hypothetical protein